MGETEKEQLEKSLEGTVASRYRNLSDEREHYLKRARLNSELTIPYLVPRLGSNHTSTFKTPYQAIGAWGVNNLASKLVEVFLPHGQSALTLTVTESVLKDLEKSQAQGESLTVADIEKSLRSLERDISTEIDASNLRVQLFELFKHMIVAGNILMYAPEGTNNVKLFRLDRYVCVRDSLGRVLELITEEELSPLSLTDEIKQVCEIDDSINNSKKNISIYTKVSYNEKIKKYEIFQECNGKVIPGTYGTYLKDKSPWICLRGIVVDGENYGRSYVEEYYGDLKSYEGLQKNIVQASAGMSKQVWMVSPSGTTDARDLANAENNAIIVGNANDVTCLRSDKHADLSVVQQTANMIAERLSKAFLLNSAIQRSGERVTAEEIKYMSKELQDGLGGLFTTISNEMMLPLIIIYLDRMEKQNKLPVFPKGLVKPMLSTGLAAMGKTEELTKINMFVQGVTQIGAQSYLNMGELVKRYGNALNVNMDGIVKTEEAIQAEQQQAQQAQMMQALGPNMVNQLGSIGKQQLEAQAQAQPEVQAQGEI